MKQENQNNKDIKLIYKARNLAFEAHKKEGQRYGIHCYSKHLSDVFNHLISHGHTGHDYLITALLHDILEDTNVSHADIETQFGTDILNNVIALTKLPNGQPNYYLLKKNPVALAVKISDTACNVGAGIIEQSIKPIKYIKRFPEYKKELYVKGEYENLWQALSERLNLYEVLVLA
jgi:hypothetical protein